MFDEEYASSILDAMDANLDSLLHSPLVDDAMHGFPPMDEASFPKTPDAARVVSYHRLGRVIDSGLNTLPVHTFLQVHKCTTMPSY